MNKVGRFPFKKEFVHPELDIFDLDEKPTSIDLCCQRTNQDTETRAGDVIDFVLGYYGK